MILLMSHPKSIEDLNWALRIYAELIKNGERSSAWKERESCLEILESFEEYEKCEELYRVLTKRKDPINK